MERVSPPLGSVARLGAAVRAGDWWHFKLPPLLAIAYFLVLGPASPPAGRVFAVLGLFLVSAAGTAAAGHLLNDWGDLEADRKVGREAALARWSTARRLATLAAALIASLLPWVWMPGRGPALLALAAELLCFALYSLPPARLKGRGAGGVVVDALYGHALPIAITVFAFGTLAGRGGDSYAELLAALFAWKLLQGICGALVSQLRDRHADRRAGTGTLVARRGPGWTLFLLDRILLPAQAIAFLLAARCMAREIRGFLVLYLLYLAWTVWRVHGRWKKGWRFYRWDYPGAVYLNQFHERWMPLATLAALVTRRPELWPLAAAHVVLFRSALADLARWLASRAEGARG